MHISKDDLRKQLNTRMYQSYDHNDQLEQEEIDWLRTQNYEMMESTLFIDRSFR